MLRTSLWDYNSAYVLVKRMDINNWSYNKKTTRTVNQTEKTRNI